MTRTKDIIAAAQPANRPVLRRVAGTMVPGADAGRALEQAVAILKQARPHYTWLGIYMLQGDTLVLGPFIGKPTEHVRIPIGAGICGLAARSKETVNVADVHADPRYLACSIETRSELVVPIMSGSEVLGEIDVDSDNPGAFTKDDEDLLEHAARLLAQVM